MNEHAWVLEDLVVRKVIEKTQEKEYGWRSQQLHVLCANKTHPLLSSN